MLKNFKIVIHLNNQKYETQVQKGKNLLKYLQENKFPIAAPCGGMGICGKCKVYLPDGGFLLACMTFIDSDMEIFLPNQQEMNVLKAQHQFKPYYPLNPGIIQEIVSFPLGLAIDVGTTTLVFYFINLITGQTEATQTQLNPQASYGSDVISRISYCNQNNGGTKTLQHIIIDATNQQIKTFVENSNFDSSSIIKIVYTGNTTMLHFLAGVNAFSIGTAPHKAVFTDKQLFIANELGIKCNPKAEVHLMPSISAFVGADIVSGLASLKFPEKIKNYLFVDIGTNGEMALVTQKKIFCCSTAAGPAFEGSNISCGMTAQKGAIDSYNKEGYTTIGDVAPIGICGSGLIDLISTLLDQNIIDEQGVIDSDYIIVNSKNTANNKDIVLTQSDIREVQLAKSALASGMLILVKQAGLIPDQVDALVIAGGFGNYLKPDNAIRIGLYPEKLSKKIIPVGNAAGTGAQMYLKSLEFESQVEKIKDNASNMELFDIDDFVVEYAMQMQFPAKKL